jgi:hypothetical protein
VVCWFSCFPFFSFFPFGLSACLFGYLCIGGGGYSRGDFIAELPCEMWLTLLVRAVDTVMKELERIVLGKGDGEGKNGN